MYQSAEDAYSSLDFHGRGFVTPQTMLEHKILKDRLPYSQEEYEIFFKDINLFALNLEAKGGAGEEKLLKFDAFKKIFFP